MPRRHHPSRDRDRRHRHSSKQQQQSQYSTSRHHGVGKKKHTWSLLDGLPLTDLDDDAFYHAVLHINDEKKTSPVQHALPKPQPAPRHRHDNKLNRGEFTSSKTATSRRYHHQQPSEKSSCVQEYRGGVYSRALPSAAALLLATVTPSNDRNALPLPPLPQQQQQQQQQAPPPQPTNVPIGMVNVHDSTVAASPVVAATTAVLEEALRKASPPPAIGKKTLSASTLETLTSRITTLEAAQRQHESLHATLLERALANLTRIAKGDDDRLSQSSDDDDMSLSINTSNGALPRRANPLTVSHVASASSKKQPSPPPSPTTTSRSSPNKRRGEGRGGVTSQPSSTATIPTEIDTALASTTPPSQTTAVTTTTTAPTFPHRVSFQVFALDAEKQACIRLIEDKTRRELQLQICFKTPGSNKLAIVKIIPFPLDNTDWTDESLEFADNVDDDTTATTV